MMNLSNKKQFAFKLSAIACAIGLSGGAIAAGLQLEEVTVTAQKRVQSIQDVSVSVAVVSGDDIDKKAIVNLEQVTANLPAVTIARNVLSQFVFIRGLGTAGIAPAQEQAVGMFTDGVYMGRPTMARAPLMDIDRVEVLRGSQSIFYGKNTLGGAIGVYTADPTEEFEGKVSALYGSDSETELKAMVSGALSDTLSARIAVRKYDMDGYLKNTVTGEDDPEIDESTARIKLLWEPSDTFSLKTSYERNEYRTDGSIVQLAKVAAFAPAATQGALGLINFFSGGTEAAQPDSSIAVNNAAARGLAAGLGYLSATQLASLPATDDFTDGETDLAVVTGIKELDAHRLTAVASYAQYTTTTNCSCDNISIPLIDANSTEDYEQTSFELRLESTDSERLEYMVGAFFQSSELDFTETDNIGLPIFFPNFAAIDPGINAAADAGLLGPGISSAVLAAIEVPNLNRTLDHAQETDTASIFAAFTWNVSDSMRLVTGLRYQQEEKKGTHTARNHINNLTPAEYDVFQATNPLAGLIDGVGYVSVLNSFEHSYAATLDDDTVSWSFKGEFDISDDALLFATVSNGNKSGGFDARSVQAQAAEATYSFDAEKALNFELGLKQDLFDGRMRLNATVFRTDVDDYQVSVFDGAINFFVDNAGELRSQGLEIDGMFRATEALTISGAFSYLDSEWLDFAGAPSTALQGLSGATTQNLTGERAVFAPEFSGNLSFNYYRQIGGLAFDGTLDINYSDEYSTAADMDPEAFYDAWTTVDLRLAIGSEDDTWQVALIGKNLTDEIKGNSSNDIALLSGAYFFQIDRLSSVALQATYNF